jgi:hypothetical protein
MPVERRDKKYFDSLPDFVLDLRMQLSDPVGCL